MEEMVWGGEIRKSWLLAAAAALILVFVAEMTLSIRGESQTFDESAHLYSGYLYWKQGDFGVNPEHPPLVKLFAALPLLPLNPPVQPPPQIFFRGASAIGGVQFLYSHDADVLLFRSRLTVSLFAIVLACLVFLAGKEMFGTPTALGALLLLVFEPNVLANGPLITTDMAASCGMFAAVYLFYRYVRRPTLLRLLLCGLASGLAMAAKHSVVLLFPVLGVLAIPEIVRRGTSARQPLRLALALAVIPVISIAVLWSFYGFRYKARPGNIDIIPPAATYLQSLHRPFEESFIGLLERDHLLPEAYLFGMTDIAAITQEGRPAFLLGKLYPAGKWFYFPMAFLIKSTIGFLLLLLLAASIGLRKLRGRREILFMAIPPVIWFAIALTSKLDIGIRHILPVYPFLMVLASAGTWALAGQSKRWVYAIGFLFLIHVGSSLAAFPNYLPYSNELFGGVPNTHKVLSDSNVGWEGGLKALRSYIRSHNIKQCWFAYDGPVNPDYYNIPCAPLPTLFRTLLARKQDIVPEDISGPVFLGSQVMAGFDWGPDDMNPFHAFAGVTPVKVLQGEILVYDGTFHVTDVSAMTHYLAAEKLFRQGKPDQALAEAEAAAQLNPALIQAHKMLASLYAEKGQPEQATNEYQTAMHIYQTVHPEFQKRSEPPQDPLHR